MILLWWNELGLNYSGKKSEFELQVDRETEQFF